jgi:hypothetical protein
MRTRAEDERAVPLVVHGIARLPKVCGGVEQPQPLILELVLEVGTQRITDVSTNIPFAGYLSLLRRLLIGRFVDDIEQQILPSLNDHCRSPLLKPTVAALHQAVSLAREHHDHG